MTDPDQSASADFAHALFAADTDRGPLGALIARLDERTDTHTDTQENR